MDVQAKKDRMLNAMSMALKKRVRDTEEEINKRILKQRRSSYFMAEKLAEMQELEAAEKAKAAEMKEKKESGMERQLTNWDGDTSQSEAESQGAESRSDEDEEENKEVDIEEAQIVVVKEEEPKPIESAVPKMLSKQDE